LTVLRLITNSNLVGCQIGRSAGFAPFRIFAVDAVLPLDVGDADPVAEQSARRGIFPELLEGWRVLPFCKTDDPVAPYVKVRVTFSPG